MDMSVWYLLGAVLVFFMQCGFAMVETGFTRAKNAGNIIMKNLMDFCIGTVVFFVLGYGIMNSENYFFGLIGRPEYQMFTDFANFDWSNFFFQLVFCATAATIVSGAMAERTKFSTYCIYSAVISAIVYPIEAGWVWNSAGWLAKLGYVDFAGSSVIHMVGGIASVIGAAMLGPRFSIKNTFYEMLHGKEKELQNIMFRYEFPNIKKDKISGFISELLQLFPLRCEQTLEEKFITGMIKRAEQSDELVFLEGNTDYVMQESFEIFYYDGPRKYFNAMHIYDIETEIQATEKDSVPTYLGEQLNNMEYVDSKSNVLIQVSDVIAGIWGKLMIYINNKDNNAIRKDVENLNKTQIENINMLRYLREKSDMYNKGFLMSVTALSVIDRINFLFDLCKVRAEKLS